MNILLTCGPAWEPIDGMRRMTNGSSGNLGTVLSEALAKAGHRVTVYRGELSTASKPEAPVDVRVFSTNDDLARQLAERAAAEEHGKAPLSDAVLHAAALCDFRIAGATDEGGAEVVARKLPTRAGKLTLTLEPATKVLPKLRGWFPKARIIGWKYELDGGRPGALNAAWRQLREAGSDACVVNGAAWGAGFGLCVAPSQITECPDISALGRALVGYLNRAGSTQG